MTKLAATANLLGYLFIDIETVPEEDPIELERKEFPHLFSKKFRKELEAMMPPGTGNCLIPIDFYSITAGLYAEFGKIISISVGVMSSNDGGKFIVKSFASENEKEILEQFCEVVQKETVIRVVGHNSFEFDFPFITRRLVINDLPIPGLLNTIDKKPWETKLEDTLKMWNGTQWKHRASLELICHVLGIPSPKEKMSADQVAPVYFADKSEGKKESLATISEYNKGDVVATAKIYCRMKNLEFPATIEYK